MINRKEIQIIEIGEYKLMNEKIDQ